MNNSPLVRVLSALTKRYHTKQSWLDGGDNATNIETICYRRRAEARNAYNKPVVCGTFCQRREHFHK